MNLSELLAEELAYWRKRDADSCDELTQYAEHGGVCEVLFLIENQEKVNRDYLLARRKELQETKVGCATYALELMATERGQRRMEAIIRIGKKIKNCV